MLFHTYYNQKSRPNFLEGCHFISKVIVKREVNLMRKDAKQKEYDKFNVFIIFTKFDVLHFGIFCLLINKFANTTDKYIWKQITLGVVLLSPNFPHLSLQQEKKVASNQILPAQRTVNHQVPLAYCFFKACLT